MILKGLTVYFVRLIFSHDRLLYFLAYKLEGQILHSKYMENPFSIFVTNNILLIYMGNRDLNGAITQFNSQNFLTW